MLIKCATPVVRKASQSAPVDGILVAHDKRGGQPGSAPIAHLRLNGVFDPLANLFHWVLPAGIQPLWVRVFGPRTHVTRGSQSLLPEPLFIVIAERVAVAVRCLEANSHLPPLARPQIGCLALQVQHGVRLHHTSVLGQVNARR